MASKSELERAIEAASAVCFVAPSQLPPRQPKPPPRSPVHPQDAATRARIAAYQHSKWSQIPPGAPARLSIAERQRAAAKSQWDAYRANPPAESIVSADTRDRLSRYQESRWASMSPADRLAFAARARDRELARRRALSNK